MTTLCQTTFSLFFYVKAILIVCSSLKKVNLIHVYPDSKEINRVFESKLSIQTDINEFVGLISNYSWFNGKKWDKWLSKLKKEYTKDLFVIT